MHLKESHRSLPFACSLSAAQIHKQKISVYQTMSQESLTTATNIKILLPISTFSPQLNTSTAASKLKFNVNFKFCCKTLISSFSVFNIKL